MSLLLVVLALATAANPVRIAVAARRDVRAVVIAAGGLTIAEFFLAWMSGPINDLIGVSVPSVVIAAGIAVVVIGARDALVSPPTLELSPTHVPPAVFPVFFPTMFTPAVALMAVAAGAERGVVPAIVAMSAGIAIAVGIAIAIPSDFISHRPTLVRVAGGLSGLGGVAIGVFVATHGVMSI